MPEKVTLLNTETFDSVLLGEHMLETMLHAWRNFLAPGCCMVTARAEFFVVPEECRQVRRAVGLLGNLECGGVRVVRDVTGEGGKKNPYLTEKLDSVHVGRMLSRPPNLFSFSFEDPEQIEELIEGKVFSKEFLATVDCECDAVAGWFKPEGDSCREQVLRYSQSERREGRCTRTPRLRWSSLQRSTCSCRGLKLLTTCRGTV